MVVDILTSINPYPTSKEGSNEKSQLGTLPAWNRLLSRNDNVTQSQAPEECFWLLAKGMSQVTDTLIKNWTESLPAWIWHRTPDGNCLLTHYWPGLNSNYCSMARKQPTPSITSKPMVLCTSIWQFSSNTRGGVPPQNKYRNDSKKGQWPD